MNAIQIMLQVSTPSMFYLILVSWSYANACSDSAFSSQVTS